jgi:hypothetical protein
MGMARCPSPLSGAVAPRVVDQDSAHHLRGDTEEVPTMLPVDVALVEEPQIDLVNECGRRQRVIDALVSQLARGNLTELLVHDRQQLVESGLRAATPLPQERRHIAC